MANRAKEFFWLALAASVLTVMAGLFMQSDHPEIQPSFQHLFASQEPWGGAVCGLILAIAYVWAKRSARSAAVLESSLLRVADNPLPLLLAVTVILAAAAIVIYHNRPLNIDEYSMYFQAKVFAEGSLWGKFPSDLVRWLVPASHQDHFFIISHRTGQIVSAYWPGFALLLAPFMKLHAPWLLNPLLTAGSLYLLCLIARRLFPHPAAPAWVLLFSLASPVITVNALSYYATTAHLFMDLLFAWLLFEQTPLRLFLAGVVGSIALVLHNPVPHLLFALPWIVCLAWRPGRVRNIGLLTLGYLPLIILLGYGWVWLKASLVQGEVLLHKKSDYSAVGVGGETVGLFSNLVEKPFRMLQGKLAWPSLNFLWLRLLAFLKIFAWAVPGLPLLAAAGGARLGRGNAELKLWGWAAVITLVGYMFVPASQGHGWGFRYFHSVWAALPLLAVFLILQTSAVNEKGKHFLFLTILLSLLLSTGLRFWQVYTFTGQHLAQLPEIPVPVAGKKQLVLIEAIQGYYAQDLVHNDPFLREDTIFLIGQGAIKDRRFMQNFPGAQKIRQKGLDSVW
ncbi:MAG: hypothetical protein P8Y63_13815, partial [Deltaproteobacteria bacterium]